MELIRRWSAERMIVFTRGRVRVDWLQTVIPLYARVLETARPEPWLDAEIQVASPEGLILTKLVSFRLQDQADIETLLIANRDEIDVGLIREEWAKVAEGEEARTEWLEDALRRFVPRSRP